MRIPSSGLEFQRRSFSNPRTLPLWSLAMETPRIWHQQSSQTQSCWILYPWMQARVRIFSLFVSTDRYFSEGGPKEQLAIGYSCLSNHNATKAWTNEDQISRLKIITPILNTVRWSLGRAISLHCLCIMWIVWDVVEDPNASAHYNRRQHGGILELIEGTTLWVCILFICCPCLGRGCLNTVSGDDTW